MTEHRIHLRVRRAIAGPPFDRKKRSILAGKLALGCLLLLFSAPVNGQDLLEPRDDFNKGGRTSFQFLKIGTGARQAGLGEASIALARDVNAVFWNPANLSGIESMQAGFNYTRWLADMNYVSGAVGMRAGRWGLFALSVASLDYGSIPEALVTSAGTSKDTRTGSNFGGGDIMVGLTYAREFTDRLTIGITAKYLRETLWDFSASNVAFDAGTHYRIGFNGTVLAMSAQNFSGAVDYLGDISDRIEGYDLPLIFRIGVSTGLIGASDAIVDLGDAHRVALAVEAINTNDFSERYHLGGEYTFNDLLVLRGGYKFMYDEGNLSLGFGIHPRFSNMQLSLDYAYVDYEFLDAPHRLSMILSF